MSTLLSKTQLARRADLDARTVAHRLKALDIRPAATTGDGRLLYPEIAVQQVRAHAVLREVTP